MSLTTIHDVGVALQAYLVSQGCPLTIVDGPEPTKTTTWGRERIVLEHDSATASFGDPRGLHTNARHSYTATDPYKITIYARSAKSGALEFEHRTRALLVRETVLSGLRYVAAVNKNRVSPKSGAFIVPTDLAGSETQAGAAYELKFSYELPIRVVTFVGDAQPEGNIAGGLMSSTSVSRTADNTDPPEVACGGA